MPLRCHGLPCLVFASLCIFIEGEGPPRYMCFFKEGARAPAVAFHRLIGNGHSMSINAMGAKLIYELAALSIIPG